MKILLLTSTGLRHFALAEKLSVLGDVTVIAETRRIVPSGGPAITECFKRMAAAEAEVFGEARDHRHELRVIPFGTLSERPIDTHLYDRIVVFGSSFIKSPLIERLVARGAINLHAGLAPEYRGSACNFWAEYDGRHDLVGCTLLRLSHELDRGFILDRVTGPWCDDDPWLNGMYAVRAAQSRLVALLKPSTVAPLVTDAGPIRVSRHADFTEAVCADYLARQEVVYA